MANKVCKLDYCEKPHYGNGYCGGHNRQFKLGKELQPLGIYKQGSTGKRSTRVPIQLGDLGYIPLSDKDNPIYTVIDWEDAQLASQFTWSRSKRGYAEARDLRDGGKVSLHQLIYPTTGEVDHKNRDSLDNRKSNLRTATRSQQVVNRSYINKTGYRGVTRTESGNYSARLSFNKVHYYIGTYNTVEEAAKARDDLAIQIQGDFAVLNFSR